MKSSSCSRTPSFSWSCCRRALTCRTREMREGVTSQVPCVGTGDRSHQFVSELEDQVGDLHLRLVFGPSQEVLQKPQSPGDPQHCSTSHSPASSYPGAAKPGVLNPRFPTGLFSTSGSPRAVLNLFRTFFILPLQFPIFYCFIDFLLNGL